MTDVVGLWNALPAWCSQPLQRTACSVLYANPLYCIISSLMRESARPRAHCRTLSISAQNMAQHQLNPAHAHQLTQTHKATHQRCVSLATVDGLGQSIYTLPLPSLVAATEVHSALHFNAPWTRENPFSVVARRPARGALPVCDCNRARRRAEASRRCALCAALLSRAAQPFLRRSSFRISRSR
jgi:hypothetical protein